MRTSLLSLFRFPIPRRLRAKRGGRLLFYLVLSAAPLLTLTALSLKKLAVSPLGHRRQTIPPHPAAPPGTAAPVHQWRENLQQALELTSVTPDSPEREVLLLRLLRNIPSAFLREALEWLLNQKSGAAAVPDLVSRITRRWAVENPAPAAEWAAALPEGAARSAALEQILLSWAPLDLSAALASVRTLPQAEHDHLIPLLAHEAVRQKPLDALTLAGDLPAGPFRTELMRRAAGEWAARDTAAALRWVLETPPATLPERDELLAGILVQWSDADPLAAACSAIEALPESRLRNDTIISIAQRFAQKEPVRAAKWVATFPPGSLRDAAIGNVTAQWASQNPAAAQVWADSLPLHSNRTE